MSLSEIGRREGSRVKMEVENVSQSAVEAQNRGRLA